MPYAGDELQTIFQSTLPRRERQRCRVSTEISSFISIHAPAKGATVLDIQGEKFILFQSTLPRRERQQFQPKILFYFQLKSTIFQIINTILPFINLLFLVKCALFVHFFWCESPGIFMSASYSHPALAAFKRFCHNISVSSTGIPRSTPMCSTFV